jgi:hypothetical protein
MFILISLKGRGLVVSTPSPYVGVPSLNLSSQCGNNKTFVNCLIFCKQIPSYYLNLEKESTQPNPYMISSRSKLNNLSCSQARSRAT